MHAKVLYVLMCDTTYADVNGKTIKHFNQYLMGKIEYYYRPPTARSVFTHVV